MSQQLMTDEAGVRFGVGAGAQFLLTGLVVAAQLPGAWGVALLLLVTAMLSVWLDEPHALGLGVAGWAFATGFAVNTLGVLTFTPYDLARLGVFVAAAALTCRLRGTA